MPALPDETSTPPPRVELTISWATIAKIFAALLIAFLAIHLSRLFELLLLALLIAITLFPILTWTRRRKWPDWIGVLLVALLLLVGVSLFAGVLLPTLGNQATGTIQKLPDFQKEAVERVPTPLLRDALNKLFLSFSFSNPEPVMKQFLAWGMVALQALAEFLVVLVVAVYFVADGERVYRWLLAFLPEKHRRKVGAACPQIASVVSSYMIGQLITSALCATYAFIVLSVLKVPNAALLAVIAGVFDILPLIGFFLALLPALLLAVSVSPSTALFVGLLYTAYHLAENYFIVPKIYGDRLRLSTLTVLVSCMAAALVAGVVGAIVILPIVACYPIVERIWLRPVLEPDTVVQHDRIEAEEHPQS